MATKFDVEKFDGKFCFSIWQIQILADLRNPIVKKALLGSLKKATTMTKEECKDRDDKAKISIQLHLSKEVLREVIYENTSADFWSKLE